MEMELRVNRISALNALKYRNARANVAILAASLAILTGLLGYYAEMIGAVAYRHEMNYGFAHGVYPPVVLTAAEVGAVCVAVTVWLCLFAVIGFSDLLLEAAGISERSRNRFGEKVYTTAMHYIAYPGVILAVAAVAVAVDLIAH
jgi:CDP-diglyceride synthetase